jgi:two-component system, OmpR family, sensor kinase
VRLSIRQRLTLWYTAAVAILLGILAFSLTVVHDRIALGRLQTDVRRINDAVATVLANELIEKGHAHAAAEEALIEVVVPGRHLAIATREGRILASRWTLPSPPPIDASGASERIMTVTAPSPATVIARALPPVPDGFVVLTAASWDELSRDRADLVGALAIVIPLALVITASGAWWVAGRALRPARIMAAEASRFSGDVSGQRLTIDRQDELGQLGTAFNGVVDRLETALVVRRQFLADASHELRTPISISRTAAEVALSREGRAEGEYRDALDVIARQLTHLGRIVSDMLTLARSDATDWPLAPTDFYFDELVAEAVDAMKGLAASGHVTTHAETPADLRLRGDERLLRQMVVNLVENAIQHTPGGGTVRVTVTAAADEVVMAVEDTGHGIPEADRERVFERFVRASPSANPGGEAGGNHAPGTGLGLAIARRIARAHDGDVRLVSTGPSGTHVAATLPRVVVHRPFI